MSSQVTAKVISSDSQTSYERWEAPHVKNIQEQKAEQAGRVTARQLEDLQKQAYDEGLQLGKDEGYKKGLILGQEEGIKNGQAVVSQTVKRFEQMIQLLAEPLEQVDKQVEEELLALSVATARQIIRREITVNPEQIIAVVKEAISALPSATKNIKVYLNPGDAEIVRNTLNLPSSEVSRDEIIATENSAAADAWSIVEEATINRGGCYIKTDNSQIDATIETRVAEISVKIFGDERASDEMRNETDVKQENMATEAQDKAINPNTQAVNHDA